MATEIMKKYLTSSMVGLVAVVGGVDASVLNEQPIPETKIYLKEETVTLKQVANVIEADMPWKDQSGFKVKYDMGEPTAMERLLDKRDAGIITETVDIADGGFKIDVILNSKPNTNQFCYTIEGAENYDFFYQPALTAEEITGGALRPEEIVGSYAVYHKTLKNHQIGKENYATGKVMHIPFPYVWETDNPTTTRQRAENLTYSNGSLCVTVQQEFLDKAKYPVRVDPTFGYTTSGASSNELYNSSDGINYGLTTFYSLSEAATPINSLSGYFSVTAGRIGGAKMMIYSDTPGSPNARQGYTEEGTFTNSSSELITVSPVSSFNLTSGSWWLAATGRVTNESAGGQSASIKYDTGGTDGSRDSSINYTTPDATWTEASANTDKYSIYANYTFTYIPEVYGSASTTILYMGNGSLNKVQIKG